MWKVCIGRKSSPAGVHGAILKVPSFHRYQSFKAHEQFISHWSQKLTSLNFFFQDADDIDYICTNPEIVRVPDPEILLVLKLAVFT